MFLIQGFFFQREMWLGLAQDPHEGSVAVIHSGIVKSMFAGIIWKDKDGILRGALQDRLGESELTKIVLEESVFRFEKKYKNREGVIRYTFWRQLNGMWEGGYEGEYVDPGKSRCVLTETGEELLDLPQGS